MSAPKADPATARRPIPKGERDELRRIVRGDFKVLCAELGVRHAELVAEIERRVADRFMAHESVIEDMRLRIGEIVSTANAQVAAVMDEAQRKCGGYELRWAPLYPPEIRCVREKREEMRRAMLADLSARVVSAKARTQRQEVDLLKRLSVDALETDQANTFLLEIPTVAELVPDGRLAELEAQFTEEGAA